MERLALSDTCPVERLKDWFGTPSAAAGTLAWVLWASFLISVALGAVFIVIAALPD